MEAYIEKDNNISAENGHNLCRYCSNRVLALLHYIVFAAANRPEPIDVLATRVFVAAEGIEVWESVFSVFYNFYLLNSWQVLRIAWVAAANKYFRIKENLKKLKKLENKKNIYV